jgi:hypothetical protein
VLFIEGGFDNKVFFHLKLFETQIEEHLIKVGLLIEGVMIGSCLYPREHEHPLELIIIIPKLGKGNSTLHKNLLKLIKHIKANCQRVLQV